MLNINTFISDYQPVSCPFNNLVAHIKEAKKKQTGLPGPVDLSGFQSHGEICMSLNLFSFNSEVFEDAKILEHHFPKQMWTVYTTDESLTYQDKEHYSDVEQDPDEEDPDLEPEEEPIHLFTVVNGLELSGNVYGYIFTKVQGNGDEEIKVYSDEVSFDDW